MNETNSIILFTCLGILLLIIVLVCLIILRIKRRKNRIYNIAKDNHFLNDNLNVFLESDL